MKSPEYITHGTASEKDAKGIEQEGFKVEEGRATVSENLIYAYEWATEEGRRKGSQSKTDVEEGEKGRIIILKTPEDIEVDYATHTDIDVDDQNKEISGYSAKYVSGRKQLGIYEKGDTQERRGEIEQAKKETNKIRSELRAYLESVGITHLDSIETKEDLVEALKGVDVGTQIEVLKKAEEIQSRFNEKRKESNIPLHLEKEHVLMSIVPTPKLGETLMRLRSDLEQVKGVDLGEYVNEITKVIQENKENTVDPDIDVKTVIEAMVLPTIESEVMNRIRSFSLKVKRAQEYTVYNRGKDERTDKHVDRDTLEKELEGILSVVERDDFDIGSEHLNRYIKKSIRGFLKELKEVESVE